MDIRRLLLTLRQQIWLLLGLTLATLAVFILLPELGKKVVYVSRCKILLTPSRGASGLTEGRTGGLDSNNWIADQQTLGELLTSERLLTRVAQVCNLRTPWQDLREQILFEPMTQNYGGKVSLFSLSVQDASPQQAQKINKAAVQEFVSYVEELSAREFANTRRFLDELVAEAKEKVDDTEERLLSITTSHSDTAESAAASESIQTLEDEKGKLRDEAAQLEAEVSTVQSYLAGSYEVLPVAVTAKAGVGLGQLQGSVDTARLKLLELEQLYTNENVLVVEQRAKLDKLRQLYETRCQQTADSILKDTGALLAEKRKQIAACEARISDIRNRQLTPMEKRQVAKLERQLNMWEENHLNLVKQLYQARVVEQSSRRQGAITVLENPSSGTEAKGKASRSFSQRLALGLPFSLGLGVAVILSIQFVGASLRLVPKIEASLGVPVLAVIPPVDPEFGELWEAYKREETLPTHLPSLLMDDAVAD